MSSPIIIEPDESVQSVKIGIVISQYNKSIIDRLLDACLKTLETNDIDLGDVIITRVPGAFEIPVITKKLASSGQYDAVITLGAIIRGETPHFDYIASSCSREIMKIATVTGVPVLFGVLTVDNMQQALDRSGDEESNKGAEAARAALDMISILRKISCE